MLNAEAWVRTANELTAAMKLLEPHVKRFAAVGQRRGRDQLMRKKSEIRSHPRTT